MTCKILMVDDKPENLVALEAALKPLQQELVSAAKTTAAYFAQRQQVVSWVSGIAGIQELQAEAGPLVLATIRLKEQ